MTSTHNNNNNNNNDNDNDNGNEHRQPSRRPSERADRHHARRSRGVRVRFDVTSAAIAICVVALLAIGGSGQAPRSNAAPPPADRVSHGAAGTARNGIGGSIAPSATMASWPGTGGDRNGGAFAFIGAQYGSLWSIPPMANNSLGVGYCVMEDVSGEGMVSLHPDPEAWDVGEMARAAALMSSFGGDLVVPYGIDASGVYDLASGEWQAPLLFGSGEYTRRRHVAVNFGVKMFVEDASPRGVAAGRKLARDTAVVAGSGSNFPALRDGYTMAQHFASVADIQHAVGGVRLSMHWGTADGAAPTAPGTYPLDVHATDATGKPVGYIPVVQLSEGGIDGQRSIGASAAIDTATDTSGDTARRTAAVATGWPTMDMASRLAADPRFALAATPASAAVTNTAGVAHFDVTIDRQPWELAFFAQAPTADVSLHAGTGIQGQITWSGPPQSASVHQVAAPPVVGKVAVRKVVEPADLAMGRELSGFEFTISPISDDGSTGGTSATVLTTGAGVTAPIELAAGRYRVVEVATPAWAAGLVDAGVVEFAFDPDGGDAVFEIAYVNREPTASITTDARDGADGDQMVDLTLGDGLIVDTVTYDGLVPGTEYVATGELMVLPAAAPVTADDADDASDSVTAALVPSGIVGSTTFVAESASGTVDVGFAVSGDAPLIGHTVVVFQRIDVASSARTVATHHDRDATEQTIWFPFVSTLLSADVAPGDDTRDTGDNGDNGDNGDGASTGPATIEPGGALVDVVTASGLRPDHRYRSDLTLHQRLDDGTCLATDTTASAEFDVSSGHGPTVFSVSGFVAPEPGVYVAFQVIRSIGPSTPTDDGEAGDGDGDAEAEADDAETGETGDGLVVAMHADCNNVLQTVQVVAPPVPTTEPTPTPTTATPTSAPAATTATSPPTTTALAMYPPARLSRTGTNASTMAATGLVLLLAGTGLLTLVRRRTQR